MSGPQSSIEQQWAELYARGVCPREVAIAVDYCYADASSRWDAGTVSVELRRIAQAAGIHIETAREYHERVARNARTPVILDAMAAQ